MEDDLEDELEFLEDPYGEIDILHVEHIFDGIDMEIKEVWKRLNGESLHPRGMKSQLMNGKRKRDLVSIKDGKL